MLFSSQCQAGYPSGHRLQVGKKITISAKRWLFYMEKVKLFNHFNISALCLDIVGNNIVPIELAAS